MTQSARTVATVTTGFLHLFGGQVISTGAGRRRGQCSLAPRPSSPALLARAHFSLWVFAFRCGYRHCDPKCYRVPPRRRENADASESALDGSGDPRGIIRGLLVVGGEWKPDAVCGYNLRWSTPSLFWPQHCFVNFAHVLLQLEPIHVFCDLTILVYQCCVFVG